MKRSSGTQATLFSANGILCYCDACLCWFIDPFEGSRFCPGCAAAGKPDKRLRTIHELTASQCSAPAP
jgi:hypothetical protein